jgi:hypothetical protein
MKWGLWLSLVAALWLPASTQSVRTVVGDANPSPVVLSSSRDQTRGAAIGSPEHPSNLVLLSERLPALLSFAVSQPPLRYARFSRTRGDYTAEHLLRNPSQLTNWGVSRFEGAIQDTGFYLKHLTNSPLIDGSMKPGEELMLGENLKYFWQMDPGHHVLGVSPKNSNTQPAAGRRFVCLISKYLIQELRCLGLNELADFNLTFSQSHFAGTNSKGLRVTGDLIVTNNTEAMLSYTIDAAPQDVYEVRYSFGGAAELPVRINKRLKRASIVGQDIDFVIENLDYGIDSKAPKGYFGLDFRSKPQPLATLLLYTNNLRFVVNRDGSLVGMDGYQHPTPVPAQRAEVSLFFVILFVGATGFCLITFGGKAHSATQSNKAVS